MRTARHTSGPLLQGRTAVISGAGRARGIGRATARLFLQHGAAVVLLDLDKGEVAQTAAELAAEESGDAIGLHCDVTDMASCRQAIAQALSWPAAAGRLDVLVNNAGITQKRGISEITAEEYQQVTDVVLRGNSRRPRWSQCADNNRAASSRCHRCRHSKVAACSAALTTAQPRPACWATCGPWPASSGRWASAPTRLLPA